MDYEKLGKFFLGRPYDLTTKESADEPLLYDSKDLTTHAVCVGMTGSGKTGLCVGLLEEAAIDGIPAIVIDPKGDLANLLLTFPDLAPGDFAPWINEDDAAQEGRIAGGVRRAAGRRCGATVSRPGGRTESASSASTTPPTSRSTPRDRARAFPSRFSTPSPRRPLRSSTTPSSWAIASRRRSRACWASSASRPTPCRAASTSCSRPSSAIPGAQGRNLDLPALIQAIQAPPFDKVGVIELESFYPAKDRFELAMAINNLLASPGFAVLAGRRAARHPEHALHAGRQAAHGDLLDRAPRRLRAHVLRLAAAQPDARLDALATGHEQPARAALHGRDLRLHAADGEAAVEEADADAAQAGPRLRRGRGSGDPESGRSRLQGAVQHRHLVHRPAADRARQDARARRARGRRGGRGSASTAARWKRRSPDSASACSS